MKDISDYFIIGDLHTAGLVSKDGSIDWLSFPHFDSATVFAKILDNNAGSFSIETANYKVRSGYIRNTAILQTIFEENNNKFAVKDFMVPQPKSKCDTHFLVRKFECLSGKCAVKLLFNPMPDYARVKPKITRHDSLLDVEKGRLMLHYPEKTIAKKISSGYELSLSLRKGESGEFILEYLSESSFVHLKKNLELATRLFWKNWVSKGKFFNFCKGQLIRSAITMKLMQFYPTGAIVAAPTTSLPEEIGGIRNWDYRYVWVRDATFTLYGLYVLGYREEARKFFGFIESIARECEECAIDVRLLYTIEGKVPPKESILDNLSGYKNSGPVRIGNDAAFQFQLDIYGSLIDSYYFMHKKGLKISKSGRELILSLVDKIASHWKQKDNGIWEIRDKTRHYTYSKVMAWVGINRALRLSDALGLSAEKKNELLKLEKDIKDWIWKNCFDEKRVSFKQHPETEGQDATNLLFVLLQFLDKRDSKTKKIVENTCRELLHKKIFIYRYLTKDGLEGKEGAFVLCTFWLISAFSILGKTKKALRIFRNFEKKMAGSGLLSEEINPGTGEYLGNYPQAFSHLGYIMSTYYLHKYSKNKK